MAAGPFLGAAILGGLDIDGALTAARVASDDPSATLLAPSWRWVFYLNVPIGLAALLSLGRHRPAGRRLAERRRSTSSAPPSGAWRSAAGSGP